MTAPVPLKYFRTRRRPRWTLHTRRRQKRNLRLTLHDRGVVPGGPVFGMSAVSRKEPFYVYSDMRNSGNHFVPSGWMGDYQDIHLDENNHDHPHSGNTCIRMDYTAKRISGKQNGRACTGSLRPTTGATKPGGYDLTGKRHLTFWARGQKGGEVISEFKMGGITGENGDSTSASTGSIALSQTRNKYTISLLGPGFNACDRRLRLVSQSRCES